MQDKLIIFQGKNVRRTWFNEEWWFSVLDIVSILTDSLDPKQYIKKIRSRDAFLKTKWGTICTPLDMVAQDNKKRLINCVSIKGAFRLIQSLPSKKAEPFKQWLAQVGYERVQEIENPELAQKRMKNLYKLKGYSNEWIEKRVRGIAIRDELTEEWKNRDVKENKEFGILTAEISKATFGMTPSEYQEFKGLKKENLRDHMDDFELIFTMLGEKVSTAITQTKDSQGFKECKHSAKEGGEVAGNARKDAEKRIGKPISKNDNYLEIPEKEKRKQIE